MTKEVKRLIKSNNTSIQATKKTLEFNTHLLKMYRIVYNSEGPKRKDVRKRIIELCKQNKEMRKTLHDKKVLAKILQREVTRQQKLHGDKI